MIVVGGTLPDGSPLSLAAFTDEDVRQLLSGSGFVIDLGELDQSPGGPLHVLHRCDIPAVMELLGQMGIAEQLEDKLASRKTGRLEGDRWIWRNPNPPPRGGEPSEEDR